eukprot:gene4266-8489_t
MGGIVSQLVYLYCKSGCQASAVASALAFFPPSPPYYDIQYDEESKSYAIELSIDSSVLKGFQIAVDLISTKAGTMIPVICFHIENASHTVIYSHGNATDCGAMFSRYAEMAKRLRVNVVAYDYTGYGVSPGYPTEKLTYTDIERIYQWCLDNIVSNPSKQLILFGQSVGSGPSCYLASKSPVAGLILLSPISSGLRVLTSSRMLSCFDIFPNIDRIKNVLCPVMIIHGMEDEEVNCNHGYSLQKNVPDTFQTPPWWVPKRGHNDIIDENEEEYY